MTCEIIYLSDPPPVDVSLLTVAAAYGASLAIVTVKPTCGALAVDATASAAFTVDETDRQSGPKLIRGLRSFIEEHSVERLFLRKGPESGPNAINPVRTKIEFLVKHKLDIPVPLVAAHVVSGWLNRRDIVLPTGFPRLSGEPRTAQICALQTAAYLYAKHGPAT